MLETSGQGNPSENEISYVMQLYFKTKGVKDGPFKVRFGPKSVMAARGSKPPDVARK